jgi:hypothetical protein
MKKRSVVVIAILLMANLHAQYKKASFLNKLGRTYDVGGSAMFLSNSNATCAGIYYSMGNETEGKRLFFWTDLELTLPTSFSYHTVDTASKTPFKVTGQSSIGILWRYNVGYYLLDKLSSDQKLLPYITAGLQMGLISPNISADNLSYDPDYYAVMERQPSPSIFNFGSNTGLGLIYKFTRVIGIKLGAGYNFVYNVKTGAFFGNGPTPGSKEFYFYKSHPYASLGIHFTMVSRD